MSKTLLLIILIFIAVLVLFFAFRKNFKIFNVPCICLITGGVKTGKSLLSSVLARKEYRKRHRKWWVLIHIFRKDMEEPLFYTNTAISFKSLKAKKPHRLDKNIRLIELDILLRKKRLAYRSVVYICESSLLSDNQDYNNDKRNAQLSLFNKLYGHSTKGGCLFYDTQSILDNHYSIKRVVSTFLFIQKSRNFWLFRVLYVRELVNMDIGDNDFNDDVDTTSRKIIVFRWNYKKYDRYYYSYLTDDLEVSNSDLELYKGELVSFNPLYRELSIAKGGKDDEKKI